MLKTNALPRLIEPMLARPAKPFDSPKYLFEVKWDGTRGMTYVDGDGACRILNRRDRDIAYRYPELSCLADLPAGTILDGEIVVMRDGKPDFNLLAQREQAQRPIRINTLSRQIPATYVVFDQLYDRHRPIMKRPLTERRESLRTLLADCPRQLCVSEGIVGDGVAYFDRACAQGLEGVVAKRLDSPYLPGKRTDAWLKIKRFETIPCVVIGFVPEGKDDFGSLIIACEMDGKLTCVGRVGSGFDADTREKLNGMLWSSLREAPVVATKEKGKWVEPKIYCWVRCMERTNDGHLRAPVFGGLYGE
jgi:DNA ligase D-like protein (predicted ligase)